MGKKCIKCGYVRDDELDKDVPENECPRCGVIYAKAEAYKGEKRKPNTKNLKECPSCKKLISKNAKICPYCGENIKSNLGWYIALSIVLIALAVFILENGHIFFYNKHTAVESLKPKNRVATPYIFISKKDCSYANVGRGVIRLSVPDNIVPDKTQLINIARDAWKQYSGKWDTGSVFIYIKDMDTSSLAYSGIDFSNNQIKNFWKNDDILQRLNNFSKQENNIDLAEQTRKKIWAEIIQAEKKATQESEHVYPIEPTQDMKLGETFQLTKATPLMPEINPVHPLAALGKMLRIPAGYFIKIKEIKLKNHTNWYFVNVYSPEKQFLKTGWINGIALMRQSKIDPTQQLKRQARLNDLLNNKYKKAIAAKYEISFEQLEKIVNEGLVKGWKN